MYKCPLICITGILQKMKEGAENVQTKIQAKVESLKTVGENGKGDCKLCTFFYPSSTRLESMHWNTAKLNSCTELK